jgi:hypothetical protein
LFRLIALCQLCGNSNFSDVTQRRDSTTSLPEASQMPGWVTLDVLLLRSTETFKLKAIKQTTFSFIRKATLLWERVK